MGGQAGGHQALNIGGVWSCCERSVFNMCRSHLRARRACWAQDPAERPAFDEVVPQLRALLDSLPS